MSKKYGQKRNQDNYIPPYDAAVLAEPIESAGFSPEVLAKLKAGRIGLVLDIVKRTERDMYKINTFNKKNLFEVKRVLQNKNLDFRPMPPREPAATGPDAPAEQRQPAEHRKSQRDADRRRPNRNEAGGQDGKRGKDRRGKDDPRGGNAPRERREGTSRHPERNKQQGRPEDRNPKQQNKRIWDADGVSEQRTKDEREKKRPTRPQVGATRDIYVKINKNDKWGFADRNGKEIVAPIYDEVYAYKDDLCCVERDNLFGFIDRGGQEIIPIEYECALSFSEGYACVCKNNKCGYINKNNELIIGYKYDAGTPVTEGNCRVKKDGKWGELFIDNPDEIRWIN